MRRTTFLVIAGFLTAAVLLSACLAEPAEPAGLAEVVVPEDVARSRLGGDLTIVMGGEVLLLDPAQMIRALDRGIVNHVFEGLTKLDLETGEPVPNLAVSWETSEDGLRQTYGLRQDVVFHDGTPFDADAVVANVRRWIDPDFPHASRGQIEMISDVRAVGTHEVEFHLSTPNPVLPNVLGHGQQHIVSPKDIEEYGMELGRYLLAGTGPFELVEFTARERIVMQPWDGYQGSEVIYLDRIIWETVPDDAGRTSRLLAGEADVNLYQSPHDVQHIEATPGFEVVPARALRQWHYYINVNQPHLSDVRIRQALNHAIDQDALIEVALLGFGVRGRGLVGPGHFGAIELPMYEYSPERAVSLMEEANYTRGADGRLQDEDGNIFEVRLDVTSGGVYPHDDAISEAVSTMLEAIGVTVNAVRSDRATFFALATFDDAARERNELVGIPVARPEQDAAIFLNVFYGKETFPPNCCNWAMVNDEEFWDILGAAMGETNMEKRAELLEKAQQVLWDHVPAVILPEIPYLVSKRKSVHGIRFSPAELHEFGFAWFEEEQ